MKSPRCRALIVVEDLSAPPTTHRGLWSRQQKKTRRCRLVTKRPSGFCWRHENQQNRAGEVDPE